MMKIGSLFAGYGGLDLGIGQILDAEPVWFVEFDKHPSAILAQHWPDVPNYGDVTAVDWETVPPVDILCGGYPCQPFSQAGTRKGTNDERHLWPYFADAIRVLRPRLVVLENVAGHLTLGFDTVLADLAALGFDAEWGVVSASDAGAPHRRQRLFIVAADAGGRQLPRPAERVDGLPVAGERGGDADGLTLLPTPKASDGPNGGPGMRNGRGVADALPGVVGQLLPTPTHDFGPYTAAIRRWEAVIGRPAPSPTEPGKDGRPRLSPAFVEFMMGLPDGWVCDTGIPRNAQLKALGNGVVPAQAALALSLLLPRLYGGEAGAVAVADDVRLLPTPTASLAGGEPAPWKPGVQWWRQSRATRNLAGIVTGNTPEWEGGST